MEVEKENVNVVIVPENILQAIKNTSDLSIDISDALNVSNIQQKDVTSEITETNNLPTISNGNIWFMFSSENLGIPSETSADASVTSDVENNVAVRPIFLDDLSSAVSINSSSSSTNPSSQYQDCILKPQHVVESEYGVQALVNEAETTSASGQNDTTKSYMFIQPTENGSNSNVYTFTPVADNYFTIKTAKSSLTPFDNMKAKSNVVDSAMIKNVAVVSQKDIVKQTANKGTHKGILSHTCDVGDCKQVFKSALECRKHKRTVHGKEKFYKCKYANCLWSFNTPYKLRRHLESHYKRKPYSCTFPGCNAVFSSDYNQRAHMKLHTTINPARVCKICGDVAPTKTELATHMRRVHNQAPEFQCNVCNKRFQTSAALVMHKRSHIPPFDFTCPVCEKKFSKRYYLKIHLYTHTGEKPYKCDQCDCGFASLSRLNRHMFVHNEDRRFTCTVEKCDKKFYRLHHLVDHMRKKHGIEPCTENSVLQSYLKNASSDGDAVSYFPCSGCGLRCLSSHGLEKHKQKCDSVNNNSDSEPEDDQGIREADSELQGTPTESIIVEIDGLVDDSERNAENEHRNKKESDNAIEESSPPDNSGSNDKPSRSNIVLDDADWSSSVLPSNNPTGPPAPYLSCQSNENQVSLVPFMDELNVLADPDSQHFLQLDNGISVCVDSVADQSNTAEQETEPDVLEQYVVASHDLNSMINTSESSHEISYSDNDSHVPNVALFEDDIPLVDVEPDACEDYSGTTINIEDIH